MAGRRNPNDPDGQRVRKKNAPDAEQEQEQEQQQETQKETETSRAQNALGNSALAAMMNARAGQDGVSGDGGGGGASHSVRRKADGEKEGQDYGGDDDIVDDMPISMEDLTQSWNPGTRKSEDRPRFVLPMPDDTLPPEDPAFLAAIMDEPHSGTLPRIHTTDAWLQPSAEVVAASMAGWASATGRWAGPALGWRSVAAVIRFNPPFLQSIDARVLPARAALGAMGSCLLAQSPAIQASPTPETAAFIELCLELEGRAHRVDNLIAELHETASKLPKAEALLAEHVPGGGVVQPAELPPPARLYLHAALDRLSRWTPVAPSVPKLTAVPAFVPDPDDPLGLDAVLEAELGPADREEGAYRHALQTAERLASEASRTRIQFVAMARVVDDVAKLWTATPATTLRAVARQLDARVDDVLRLLLDVARAAQKRSYPPPAMRNGLLRAARQIDDLRAKAIGLIGQICGGLLPGLPELDEPPAKRPDPLSEAMASGVPPEALPWLRGLPTSPDHALAEACLMAIADPANDPLPAAFEGVRQADLTAGALGPRLTVSTLALAHAHLRQRRPDRVLPLADAVWQVGRSRRNGLLVAAGALLAMEAHLQGADSEQAEQIRRRAGRLCWDLGARGALSLLARWTPPSEEPADLVPFFDYGAINSTEPDGEPD